MNARRILSIAALLAIYFSSFGQDAETTQSSGQKAQDMPSNRQATEAARSSHGKFEIGEFIKTDDHDNLVIFFNCQGRIVERSCAEFYRTGKMDCTDLSLAGPVKDYYTNDTLAFEAFLENSLLNGPALFYHRNGKVMAKGRYSENNRAGVWTYFYDNGNPEKIINFVRGYPLIVAYHQRNGKQSVVQGNGRYKNKFLLGSNCSPYEISGRVVEGMLHGKWKIYSDFNHQKVATEFYDHGKFIKRKSKGEVYTGQPMIRIHGFSPNESLLWTENIAGCISGNFQALKYRGEDIHARFYTEALDSLHSIVSDTIRNQWLIAGIQLGRNNIVHTVKIKSSIGDKDTEDKIRQILKSMVHFSVDGQYGNAEEAKFMFTILFRDNNAIIPADYYFQQWMKSMPQFDDSEKTDNQENPT